MGFPGGSDSKEPACSAEDPGSIPGLGRSPGEGNGYSLQYSCLENSMDRETWQPTVYRVAKSRTRLSNCACVQVTKKKTRNKLLATLSGPSLIMSMYL